MKKTIIFILFLSIISLLTSAPQQNIESQSTVSQQELTAPQQSTEGIFQRIFPRVIILLIFLVWGLFIIASGQVFLAIRETALNTRSEQSKSISTYNVLLIVAKVNNFLGWFIIGIGFLVAIFANIPSFL